MKKFLFEALFVRFHQDQAANPCGVLAWSYAQSRVFDPPSVFDANAWNPICFMNIHCQHNSANGFTYIFLCQNCLLISFEKTKTRNERFLGRTRNDWASHWTDITQQTGYRLITGLLVPKKGLEPSRLSAHAPETCASTNSATWAFVNCGAKLLKKVKRAKENGKIFHFFEKMSGLRRDKVS